MNDDRYTKKETDAPKARVSWLVSAHAILGYNTIFLTNGVPSPNASKTSCKH